MRVRKKFERYLLKVLSTNVEVSSADILEIAHSCGISEKYVNKIKLRHGIESYRSGGKWWLRILPGVK